MNRRGKNGEDIFIGHGNWFSNLGADRRCIICHITGSMDISGSVDAELNISDVPDSFDFAGSDQPLAPGHKSIVTTVDRLKVQSNIPWAITVKEDGDGKMSKADGGTLQNAMEVHSQWAQFFSGSPALIANGPAGEHVRTVSFIQDVLWTDTPGDYSITVVFIIGPQV